MYACGAKEALSCRNVPNGTGIQPVEAFFSQVHVSHGLPKDKWSTSEQESITWQFTRFSCCLDGTTNLLRLTDITVRECYHKPLENFLTCQVKCQQQMALTDVRTRN